MENNTLVSPTIIKCNTHIDVRGTLIFCNEFDMRPIRRFYQITHPTTQIVRAWQGHKIEQKWFRVLTGGFDIYIVKPDSWVQPSPHLEHERFFLNSQSPAILHVPGGFVTGIKASEPNSMLLVYSDSTIKESQDDDFRFKSDLWVNWHQ